MTKEEIKKKYDPWFVARGDGSQAAVDKKGIVVAIALPMGCSKKYKNILLSEIGKKYGS